MSRFRLTIFSFIAICFSGNILVSAQNGKPILLADEPLTSENSLFSLQYPEGWFTGSEGATVYLANTEANLQKLLDADLTKGEAIIRVTVDTPTRLIETFGLDIDYDPTPLGFLTPLSEQLEASGYELETAPYVIGDPSLAYLRVSGENNQGQIQVINIGYAFAVIQAVAAPKELAYWQKTIEAVSNTIEWDQERALDREASSGDLTESFAFGNTLATLLYPKEWFVNELRDDVVAISNNEDAAAGGRPFMDGSVVVLLRIDTLANWQRDGLTVPDDAGGQSLPLSLLQSAIDQPRFGVLPAATVDEPVELTLGEKPAASVIATIAGFEQSQIIFIEVAEGIIAEAQIIVKDEELSRWQPIALEIVKSLASNVIAVEPQTISIPEMDLPESYTSADGKVRFNFPLGWYADSKGVGIMVGTSQGALDYGLTDAFQPGEVQIFVRAISLKSAGSSGSSPLDVMADVVKSLSANENLQIGKITSLQIGDFDASLIGITSPASETNLWVIELSPGVMVVIRLTTTSGEVAQWTPTALAIAASIIYSD